MGNSFNKTLIQTIGLGNVAGIRPSVAPAILSNYYNQHKNESLDHSKLSFMQTSGASLATKLLGALEVTGDKIPGVPNRTVLPQLLARVASGALVGAVLFEANNENMTKGAVIGGLSALASTFVSFYARRYFGQLFSLNNTTAGAIEDAIAVGGGNALMNLKKV